MQTLGDIRVDDLAITMMSVLVALALYTLYCIKNEQDHNLKVVVAIMIIVTVSMLSLQKYDYNSEESRVLNRFNSAEDIICKFNDDRNIIISKKRGYELKSSFFIKDEMAVKLGSCYLLE
jgi:hypothetical protein